MNKMASPAAARVLAVITAIACLIESCSAAARGPQYVLVKVRGRSPRLAG